MSSYAVQPRYFPRFPVTDLSPLLRLFDGDDDDSSGDAASQRLNPTTHPSHLARTFQPRFDVREDANSFTLHGELPGLDRKDIQIEFADQNTLVVHGRTVREYHEGDDPQTQPAEQQEKGKLTEGGSGVPKPIVEDEGEAGSQDKLKPTEHQQSAVAKQETKVEKPRVKYWISERSVGEFHRSFTFPGLVDHEGVKANLKDGIITIVVPKAARKESKKINIE